MSQAVRIGSFVLGVALLFVAFAWLANGPLNRGSIQPQAQSSDTGCLTIALKVSEAPRCDRPRGISADTAVRLARSHLAAGATFESADARELRGWSADAPDRLIWAVTFTTEIFICPPVAAPCMTPRKAETIVIVDYRTGDFVESATYAPRESPVRARSSRASWSSPGPSIFGSTVEQPKRTGPLRIVS